MQKHRTKIILQPKAIPIEGKLALKTSAQVSIPTNQTIKTITMTLMVFISQMLLNTITTKSTQNKKGSITRPGSKCFRANVIK